jgi:DNA-binding GntR family transcriptional regulator
MSEVVCQSGTERLVVTESDARARRVPSNGGSIGGRHQSLRDALVAELRERIINREFEPGQRLVERELSELFEVSRIPLREAILQVEADGLVRSVPRRGAFVASFSLKEVEDLFDLRETIEPLAGRLAARRAESASLDALRADFESAEDAARRGDKNGVARANAAFHQHVIDMADNTFLTAAMRPLSYRLRWLFRLTSDIDAETMCREHRAFFDALVTHDVAEASECALRHVQTNRDETIALFRAHGWGVPPSQRQPVTMP